MSKYGDKGGLPDILSNHLYKSPDVFVRELLQNDTDAITMREKAQIGWNDGRITISVEEGQRLVLQTTEPVCQRRRFMNFWP